jgi:hypothetical protein
MVSVERTVSALRSRPLPQTLRAILDDSPSQLIGSKPMISVATFLYRGTIMSKGEQKTSLSVLQRLFLKKLESNEFDSLIGKIASSKRSEVSPGLWQAFQEAYDIRARTGGKDESIGLRHVLFAMFTTLDGPLADDVAGLFAGLGIDRSIAVHEIVDFCLDNSEPQEKLPEWQRIMGERGIEVTPGRPPGSAAASSRAKRKPRKIVARDPEVALLQADDPWSGEVRDRSGATAEAEAFAAMICASQFAPPLAVGVFGEWGSGKSFFMRLVHEAIRRRTARAAGAASGSAVQVSDGVTFLTNVAQIRFNAWHYVETNLWASLVNHIFTSLDSWAEAHNNAPQAERLFEQLATARRLTVESAETLIRRRKERQQAVSSLAEAELALEARRKSIESKPLTWAKTAWSTAVGDKKPTIDKAAKTLGLGDTIANAGELRAAAAGMDDALARYALFKSATVRALAIVPVIALVTLGILFLPPFFAWLAVKWQLAIPPVAAAVTGVLAPIAAALGWASRKAMSAIAVVNRFRDNLESKLDELSKADEQNAEHAQKELTAAVAAAAEAQERLEIAAGKVVEAERDYNIYNGKGRVLRFVRERVANRDYEKHLSFVATVRKDFQELSDLMTPVAAPPDAERARQLHRDEVDRLLKEGAELLDPDEKQKLEATKVDDTPQVNVFERIVLYIDDLDRCPPKQVVDVLQAIHLLLAFPLFVVFVAVDVRWLKYALSEAYPGQLEHDKPQETASPSDYLEKIFQVPYWVRPMTVESTRALLNDQMGPDAAALVGDRATTGGTGRQSGGAEAGGASGQEPASTTAALGSKVVSLRLTPNERAFIGSLAESLDHSPRRTLRFINTYRILKASLAADEVRQLETRGYKSLLTLLTLAIASERDATDLLDDLVAKRPFKRSRVAVSSLSAEQRRIQTALKLFEGSGGKRIDLAAYARLVSRFSFEPAAP